ncbi:MAG: hypothetical protein KDE51_08895 [Anaerolineales bacterium]|nr:hypothetical protein [Anaerolineales bacterium]
MHYEKASILLIWKIARAYFSTIGRYTNRIARGRFTFNSAEYVLIPNDCEIALASHHVLR